MRFDFSKSKMSEIISQLKEKIPLLSSQDIIELVVLNPDLGSGLYAGETVDIDGTHYPHHSLKAWNGLAELLGCRMLIPLVTSNNTVIIRYQKLLSEESFHTSTLPNDDITEKYGSDSKFSKINKLEEPTFAWAYLKSLEAVRIQERKAVLDLGINQGDEFAGIKDLLALEVFKGIDFVGIDHSSSALDRARVLLPYPNIEFIRCDINELDNLKLTKQDLIISIGTLQSPNIDTKPLLMSLVQEYLTDNGAIILGFPNARWRDGEIVYGAKAPNYPYPELSLVIKDIYWIKKYLQQHKFRVTITGREYLFLTATKIEINKRGMGRTKTTDR